MRLRFKDEYARAVLLQRINNGAYRPYNSLYLVSPRITSNLANAEFLLCDFPTMTSGWGGHARAMMTGHLPLCAPAERVNVEDYEYLRSIKPLGDIPGFQSPGIRANRSFRGMIGQHRITSTPAVGSQRWASAK